MSVFHWVKYCRNCHWEGIPDDTEDGCCPDCGQEVEWIETDGYENDYTGVFDEEKSE